MHACGHDGHTAMLLTVAEHLAPRAAELKKAVVLIFQPAEEGFHGAKLMVDDGVLQDCTAVYGAHLWTTLPTGQVGVSPGPVMANSDRFVIQVNGRGGHGSMPQDACDPVLAAAALVQSAQQIVARQLAIQAHRL